jgi:cell division septum initiation protein DivIVA
MRSPCALTIKAYQSQIEILQKTVQSLQAEIKTLKQKNSELTAKILKDENLLIVTQAILRQQETLLNKLMNESTDKSQKINVGGNFNINATQSVVNLRDIIGDVNHTINQIPADNSPQNQELKTLLQELTEAIQIEATLDDEEKAEAANQVKKIAQASQSPDDSALQTKAKKAVNLLETISKGLEPASKLFKACQKILPLILGFLGL